MSEHEALAAFHQWADTRRRRSWHVAFFVRYTLGCLLLWISSGCVELARLLLPAPQ
jgi:hypothetical protein